MKGYYGKMCKWPMVSLKRVEWRDMEVLSVQIQTLNRLIYFPEVFPILFCFQLAKATIACNYKLWFKTYPIFFSWIFKFSSHCCLKKKELKKWISFKYDHLLRTTFLVQPVFEPHASHIAKQQLYYFGINLGFWETAHLPLP